VYKKEEVEQVRPHYDPASSMREKVIVIYPSDTAPKPKPRRIDTVIILKKGLTKEQIAEREKDKAVEVLKNNNYFSFMKMDIKVATTLDYATYLSYDFIFKNDCKIDVFVSSKHFRFTPFHTSGKPVKVLRKLSFVKRFDHPDFVKLAPGETYTFNYSDDAFFEYDLKRGQSYKFVFEHRNFGERSKTSPEKTYLCGQQRTQLITIK
ncbi:MAG: hypothetical protein KDC07_03835, partial [Chitinophagaceae bacterium]|nr:hypothetical protein [Chitinophagaceae bacterium]